MPKISIIIPTYNRPEKLKRALVSVLNQSHQDFEVIVVDDGLEERAQSIINELSDSRIRYIQHSESKGGGSARNTGISNSQGDFIAFLDDDDEWVSDKLSIQMNEFENTSDDVGFCFSGVENIYKDHSEITQVKSGINNYHSIALRRFKGFLTITLIIKKKVFEDIGLFDINLPSHQEVDLIIRITKKYKGLGISKPLAKVYMSQSEDHIGGNIQRRISGRKMIIEKHKAEFSNRDLAFHLFQLAIWYRDSGDLVNATQYFRGALIKSFNLRYLIHYLITRLKV